MRSLRLLLYAVLTWLLAGCGTNKHLPIEVVRDSVSVVVKESVIYKDTTIYVEVPMESDKAVLPDSDTSRLETSIAYSEAWVNKGKLNHTLKNKPDLRIPKIVAMPVYLTTKETEHLASNIITKEVEVEKELTQWQVFRMMLGTIVLIAIGIWLLFIIIKRVLLK